MPSSAPSMLDQLKQMTVVVADTGEWESLRAYAPEDATTNPSLILKSVQTPDGAALLAEQIRDARQQGLNPDDHLSWVADRLTVAIGRKILAIVPGRVSTEVDARLSFNTAATIAKARELIQLYQDADMDPSRILIKIASTWEGIQAARQLEQEGIRCNLTLLFSKVQARACAEAGATLISPFVGRILDWYKQKTGEAYTAETDPGVLSVREIYRYYKQHGYPTIVMGASFRNVDEILALAGCDRLTISPGLLDQLSQQTGHLVRQLNTTASPLPKPAAINEVDFRWQLNQDAMATEKLAEGIRLFARDQDTLFDTIRTAWQAS